MKLEILDRLFDPPFLAKPKEIRLDPGHNVLVTKHGERIKVDVGKSSASITTEGNVKVK